MTQTYTYYIGLLDQSGFVPESHITENDFGLIHATATDQVCEYFPPSRWIELGASSVSVRGVSYPLYERCGVLAWARLNDVFSEGSLFDVDAIMHESGNWQIAITELDVNDDDAHNYAYVSDSPFYHIHTSLDIGFKKECEQLWVRAEIEEMTEGIENGE